MKITQLQNIEQHLVEGKTITPIEALNLYGCFRLAARISDLRNDNMKITTTRITKNGSTFASYKMEL